MNRPRAPLFLARQSYRRRRIMDAARFLPLLGVFLVLLPILWQPAATAEPDTARGMIYLFSVWFLLIVAAFGLVRILSRREEPGDSDQTPPDTPDNPAGGHG